MRKSILCVVLATGLAGGSAAVVGQDREANDRSDAVVIASGTDRAPSYTAREWVTWADHVAYVSVIKEQALPLGPDERKTGEGLRLRVVTLQVKDKLWSSPSADEPLPSRLSYLAYGWLYKGKAAEESPRMVGEGSPRLEKGHQYVMALDFDACQADKQFPWQGIGDGGDIPADGGMVGAGEFEGRPVTPTDGGFEGGGSLRDDLQGRPVDDLRAILSNARPIPADERPVYPADVCPDVP